VRIIASNRRTIVPLNRYSIVAIAAAAACISDQAAGLPSDLTFVGHCDGLTDIRFIPGKDVTDSGLVVGRWNRDACSLPSADVSGLAGTVLSQTRVTGTYDTQALGIETMLVRIGILGEWEYFNGRGKRIADGQWEAGKPGSGSVGLPPSLPGPGQADRQQPQQHVAAAGAPRADSLPPDLRFDGHCDGLTGLEARGVPFLNTVITGTWNVEACGLPSTTLAGLTYNNGPRISTAVATYDTATQGLGFPALTLSISLNGSWIYYDTSGNVLNSGTWSAGLPIPDGGISLSP
jgi:hypothetical protein